MLRSIDFGCVSILDSHYIYLEILDMMGLAGKYSCEPPPLDESSLQVELVKQDLHPREYTRRLAEAKAHSLAAEHSTGKGGDSTRDIPVFYLGSDTVVEIDDRLLEKPKDEDEAKAMLRRLSGRQVISKWHWAIDQQISLTCCFLFVSLAPSSYRRGCLPPITEL